MNFIAWLKQMFTPLSMSDDNAEMDDQSVGFEWTQNVRIILAIVVVIVSAFILYWIVA